LHLWHRWSIVHAATARPHRHACEVVSDKGQLKHKVQNIAGGNETKQSDAVLFSCDGAG